MRATSGVAVARLGVTSDVALAPLVAPESRRRRGGVVARRGGTPFAPWLEWFTSAVLSRGLVCSSFCWVAAMAPNRRAPPPPPLVRAATRGQAREDREDRSPARAWAALPATPGRQALPRARAARGRADHLDRLEPPARERAAAPVPLRGNLLRVAGAGAVPVALALASVARPPGARERRLRAAEVRRAPGPEVAIPSGVLAVRAAPLVRAEKPEAPTSTSVRRSAIGSG
jgi:hypothetical protein